MKHPSKSQLSVNQLIARNLFRARELKGWTQEQAAQRLEPYLGQRWSKATFSAAERSLDGRRPREFTVNEIVAFAAAFGQSLDWFFVPPTEFAEFDLIRTDRVIVAYDAEGKPLLTQAIEPGGLTWGEYIGIIVNDQDVPVALGLSAQLRRIADAFDRISPVGDLSSVTVKKERRRR
jgi:transcriptional regulator with XRE-family HTH domain